MIIHVVQKGETIDSIAELYGVSAARLILENELPITRGLIPGQTIVITFPEQTYIVQEGDSLKSIANAYGVTNLQLLRNNPYLSDREYIYPGETLVISYNNKSGKISTNGFANVFIYQNTLRKTLPSLTYLSIIGYRIIEDADLVMIDDAELIRLAKEYNVAPLMFLSTITAQGQDYYGTAYRIIHSETLMDRLIDNTLNILKSKGYYGLIVSYSILNSDTVQNYRIFNAKLVNRLKNEGFPVFVIISPIKVFLADQITFEKIDYSELGQEADIITILNYIWGYNYGPPAPLASIQTAREFLEYIISQISPDKIDVGIPVLGYDWPLPYVIGVTRAKSLSINDVLILASQFGAIIQFDETSQTPYFEYVEDQAAISIKHIVWFIDARIVDALVKLIPEYGLHGKGVWNIMHYYAQMWLVINSQYEIEKILHALD